MKRYKNTLVIGKIVEKGEKVLGVEMNEDMIHWTCETDEKIYELVSPLDKNKRYTIPKFAESRSEDKELSLVFNSVHGQFTEYAGKKPGGYTKESLEATIDIYCSKYNRGFSESADVIMNMLCGPVDRNRK